MDRETEIRVRDSAIEAHGNKCTGPICSHLATFIQRPPAPAKKGEMMTVDKIAHFGIFTMVHC